MSANHARNLFFFIYTILRVAMALYALRGCIFFTVQHGIGSMSRFTSTRLSGVIEIENSWHPGRFVSLAFLLYLLLD